jgi:hypothetical protein
VNCVNEILHTNAQAVPLKIERWNGLLAKTVLVFFLLLIASNTWALQQGDAVDALAAP